MRRRTRSEEREEAINGLRHPRHDLAVQIRDEAQEDRRKGEFFQ